MDRWLWSVYEESGKLECPICERVWKLNYPYTVDDMRHCPWCGERLDLPKGDGE